MSRAANHDLSAILGPDHRSVVPKDGCRTHPEDALGVLRHHFGSTGSIHDQTALVLEPEPRHIGEEALGVAKREHVQRDHDENLICHLEPGKSKIHGSREVKDDGLEPRPKNVRRSSQTLGPDQGGLGGVLGGEQDVESARMCIQDPIDVLGGHLIHDRREVGGGPDVDPHPERGCHVRVEGVEVDEHG
jgi:hypothetical protein